MSLVLLLTGLGLLAMPACARGLGRRLRPEEWARLAAAALFAGAVAVEVALVLLAAPTVLRALAVPALAAACTRIFGELALGGANLGLSAAVLAVLLPTLAVRSVIRFRRTQRDMRIESWLGAHQERGGIDLVVLPSRELVAYSVAGENPQVVISQGLAETLDHAELAAVLRHEHAHLRFRHHRYLALAAVVEYSLPVSRVSTAPLRMALERWADEHAAGKAMERRSTVRAALLVMATSLVAAPDVAAFGGTPTLLERVDALEGAPIVALRTHRIVAYVLIGGLGLLGAFAVAQWIVEARMMLAMAGYCPS